MTPWAWYWMEPDDDGYGMDAPTREAVIEEALRWLKPGDPFEIIEARMSDAQKYDGCDIIPFLRTRNAERLVVSPDGKTAQPQAEGGSR